MITNFIAEAIENTGVQARELCSLERQNVIENLHDRLGIDITAKAPWDNAEAPEGKLRQDGWELIPKYVGAIQCFVFTPGANEIWEFDGEDDLLRVLRECPALEFYVCDCDFDYLLCFNHHDYVVGWGRASSWVDSLPM